MTYDATRDCLWVGYYYDNEVGQINATNGSTIKTKVPGGRRVYALDMEGADLWVADYYEKKFRKFNPDTMANTQTIGNPWGTGIRPLFDGPGLRPILCSAVQQHEICRLNTGSGAVRSTLSVAPERFSNTYNHHDAINGKVWYSRYNAPRNRIHCMDGTSGNLLTYARHGGLGQRRPHLRPVVREQQPLLDADLQRQGRSQRWAHLVDLSGAGQVQQIGRRAAACPPAVQDDLHCQPRHHGAADRLASGDADVRLERSGRAVYEKEIFFIIHEDAPNNPPTADAGPDVKRHLGRDRSLRIRA